MKFAHWLSASFFFLLIACSLPSEASAATLYWHQAGADANWNTLTGNWWTDSDLSVQAGSLPAGGDDVITAGTTSPRIIMNSWTSPASIVATSSGIWVTAYPGEDIWDQVPDFFTSLTGDATFNGTALLGGEINGNVTFRDYSRNYGSIISGHTVLFYDNAGNVRGINGIIGFYGNSFNADDITGAITFNDSSVNLDGAVIGNATFNDSSLNQNAVTGTATFNGDSSENQDTARTGTSVRRYTSNISTTRDFVSGGPWTVIADGAVVNMLGATYNGSTILTAANGGSFIPTQEAGGCGSTSSVVAGVLYTTKCGVTTTQVLYQPMAIPTPSSAAAGKAISTVALTTAGIANLPAAAVVTNATSSLNAASVAAAIATSANRMRSFSADLKFGDQKADVLELQKLLKSLGYFKLAPNGYFGPSTRAAVIAFQKANKLVSTGFFGPLTRSAAGKAVTNI